MLGFWFNDYFIQFSIFFYFTVFFSKHSGLVRITLYNLMFPMLQESDFVLKFFLLSKLKDGTKLPN